MRTECTAPELPDELREDADTLEQHGCVREADQLRRIARQVEIAWRAYWDEPLPVDQAAEESGYAVATLRQMVHDGRIPDLRPPDSQGRIRIRRRDLPIKPPNAARGQRPSRTAIPVPEDASTAERLAAKAGLQVNANE